MIPLNSAEYEAIGHVAVESGTLEREVGEYIGHFRAAPITEDIRKLGLAAKLTELKRLIEAGGTSEGARIEFNYLFGRLSKLVTARDAAIHGVWSLLPNSKLKATTLKGSVRAENIHRLNQDLRLSRKALLRLVREHFPALQITKNAKASASDLIRALRQQAGTWTKN